MMDVTTTSITITNGIYKTWKQNLVYRKADQEDIKSEASLQKKLEGGKKKVT